MTKFPNSFYTADIFSAVSISIAIKGALHMEEVENM